jgi:hypothetical protein
MNYEGWFKERLDALCAEGRYRVFADLEALQPGESAFGPEIEIAAPIGCFEEDRRDRSTKSRDGAVKCVRL